MDWAGFGISTGFGGLSCRGAEAAAAGRGFLGGSGGGAGRAAGAAAFDRDSGLAATGEAVCSTGRFLRRGGRGGLGCRAFIERLIRFIVGSTPITFTLTMSPTFTASRAS